MLESTVSKKQIEMFLKDNNLHINQMFLSPIYAYLDGSDSSIEWVISCKQEEILSVTDALRFLNPLVNRFYTGKKEDNPFYILTESLADKKIYYNVDQLKDTKLTRVQRDILTRLKGYLAVENRLLKKAEKLTGVVSKRKSENKIKLGIIENMLSSGTLTLAKHRRDFILYHKPNFDKHHIYDREVDLIKNMLYHCNLYPTSNTLQIYDCLPINELDYLDKVDIYCSEIGSLGVKNNTTKLHEFGYAFLDSNEIPNKKNLIENSLVLNNILAEEWRYNECVISKEDVAKKLFFKLCKLINTKPTLNTTVYIANIEGGVITSYTLVYLYSYIVNEPLLSSALLAHGVINRNKTNHPQSKDYVLFNSAEKYNIVDRGLTVLAQFNKLVGYGFLKHVNTDLENMVIGNNLLIDKQDTFYDNDSANNMETAIIECGIYYEQDNLDMDNFNKVAEQHNLDTATLIYNYYNQ